MQSRVRLISADPPTTAYEKARNSLHSNNYTVATEWEIPWNFPFIGPWHRNCDLLVKRQHLICHMSFLWPNNEAYEFLPATNSAPTRKSLLFLLFSYFYFFPPEDTINPLSNVYRASVVNKLLQVKQKTALQSNTDSVFSAYLSVASAVNAAIHDVSIDHQTKQLYTRFL